MAKLQPSTEERRAQRAWRRLKDENKLPKVIQGIKCTDDVITDAALTRSAA